MVILSYKVGLGLVVWFITWIIGTLILAKGQKKILGGKCFLAGMLLIIVGLVFMVFISNKELYTAQALGKPLFWEKIPDGQYEAILAFSNAAVLKNCEDTSTLIDARFVICIPQPLFKGEKIIKFNNQIVREAPKSSI